MVQKFQYTQADISTRTARIAQFEPIIQDVAAQQGVSPNLIKAIIAIESSGNPLAGAERTVGAKGLMQIIDQTWRNTIQRYPTLTYKGQPLTAYMEREVNSVWQDPALNILIGVLAIKLKALALTKNLGINITPDDPSDILLLLTTYNAGEFTVGEAYKNAVANGYSNPTIDFLEADSLKPAINTVVTKFNLKWDVDAKFKEIGEYAGRVLTFLEIYGGKPITPQPSAPVRPVAPTPQPAPSTPKQPSVYAVMAGDTGFVIARKLGVGFDVLQAANPSVNWSRLSIGQPIQVPSGASAQPANPKPPVNTTPPRPSRSYVVQKGEGLGIIAKKFGVSVDALRQANLSKLKKWGAAEGFSVGETITIPA